MVLKQLNSAPSLVIPQTALIGNLLDHNELGLTQSSVAAAIAAVNWSVGLGLVVVQTCGAIH